MICPICQHETRPHLHPDEKLRFYVCPFCEVCFKDIDHYPSLEEEKRRYQAHQNNLDNQHYVTYLKNFIHLAITPFDVNHLLDYGCGPSPVLQSILKEMNYDVDLYDPFFYPDQPQKTYDMVISTEVFEHFHHPIASFEHINQLICPQGYLSIMTLFRPMDLDAFDQWFYIRDITHVILYTPKTLKIIAQRMGWHMIFCDNKRIAVFQKK